MGQTPQLSKIEPIDIIGAFLRDQNRESSAELAAARRMEAAPVEMQLELEKARAAKRLGLEFLPQELDIRDAVEARQSQRAEARGMRERTHSADEQIRANINQLETSDRLAEGRDERQQARRWGYTQRERDLTREDTIAQEDRAFSRDIAKGRIGVDQKVEERERTQRFDVEKEERLQRQRMDIIDEKSRDAQELARLRGEEARRTQSSNWADREQYFRNNPTAANAARSGKILLLEKDVVYPKDIIDATDMKADTKTYEYLGPGQGPKGEKIERFKIRNPTPQEMVPNPRQAPAANRGAQSWSPPAVDTPAKSGVVPEGASTPKSGDRLQRNSEVDQRDYKPARLASDASPELQNLFERVGDRFNIDPDILASHTFVESGWNANARSRVGAQGIAQFMPATAQTYGVDPSNVVSSVIGMAKYMNKMGPMFNDNLGLVVAGYNWGEGSSTSTRGVMPWLRNGADPRRMPEETRNHVLKVTGKPIEYWVDQYFEDQQTSRRPKVTATNEKNESGDDLFYVDVG